MTSTLIDTNILIDIMGPDSPDRTWSLRHRKECYLAGDVILSPVVWSELSAAPLSESELLQALDWLNMVRETLSFEATAVSGKSHRRHRMAGGQRERTLPDFLIGAQASLGDIGCSHAMEPATDPIFPL